MINESTLERLKQGDPSVVDEVIIAHMDLANKLARYFARKHPHRADDIAGAAMLGLCKAVNKIREGVLETDKVKTYINNSIRRNIMQFIQQDHLIHIPNWFFAKHADEDGFFIPIMYTIDRRDDDEENQEEGEELTFDVEAPQRGDEELVREFYMKLTNFEKIVLDLRAEGYTLEEIGEQVGKSYVWINKTLNKIKDKMILERAKHGR